LAYIYKITNKINGKIYIGKTTLTIPLRWKEYKWKSRNALSNHVPLYQAMAKYGINNFEITEIEQCNDDDVDNREKYWISFYDSYNNGYNATLGGEGKATCDHTLIYSLWNTGKDITQIAEITGYGREAVRNALDKYGISIQERLERGYHAQGRVTAKLDKETEEILEVFPTAEAAARALGKNKGTNIQACCKNKRKTAYGFKWRYLT
jgi:group I intron endonuclease